MELAACSRKATLPLSTTAALGPAEVGADTRDVQMHKSTLLGCIESTQEIRAALFKNTSHQQQSLLWAELLMRLSGH